MISEKNDVILSTGNSVTDMERHQPIGKKQGAVSFFGEICPF